MVLVHLIHWPCLLSLLDRFVHLAARSARARPKRRVGGEAVFERPTQVVRTRLDSEFLGLEH